MAAVLTSNNVKPVYTAGQATLIALYALANVSVNDTIDLGTIGNNASFMVIKSAVVLGDDVFVAIAANFTGTVVTMPPGLSANSAYLLVRGS